MTCLEPKTQRSYDHRAAQSRLLKDSVTLNADYQQVAFELRFGRLSGMLVFKSTVPVYFCSRRKSLVKSVKPLISIIEHLRREVTWGMSFQRVSSSESLKPDNQILSAFREPAKALGNAIAVAMKTVEDAVLAGYQNSSLIRPATAYEASRVESVGHDLEKAQQALQHQLAIISDRIDLDQRMVEHSPVDLSRELFDMCLFMVSLLQVH
jgi:hypothetical protein